MTSKQLPTASPLGLPPPVAGKLITILSIDGGGVRGIIPGVILEYLESQLQERDGNNARLADYFDVISGTSTGGLIAAMLTVPNEDNKPKFAANEIVKFYMDMCPKVFKPVGFRGYFTKIIKMMKALVGPIYDGKDLKTLLKDQLGTTKMSQTLTNVVIPTFDIKEMKPVIFSSYQVSRDKSMDAKLFDICLGTSAAPTYLPAHDFNNGGREFNLIDGGITANNPSLVAIGEIIREVMKSNPNLPVMKPLEYERYLLISIGTGTQKLTPKYDAKSAAKWGVLGWLVNQGSAPLIDAFTEASASLVVMHNNVVFEALSSDDNYLRIQADGLTGDLASVDVSTKENLEGLVKVGEALLDTTASRVNYDTGEAEPVRNGNTNRDALKWFARRLSEEREIRKSNFSNGKVTH